MFLTTKQLFRVFIATGLLLALAGCGSNSFTSQSTPNMVDYSYIPPADGHYTVLTTPGIEAF